jgi:hypothetical protein
MKIFKKVTVVKTPISERYCNVGDEIDLDPTTNRVRFKGVWFGLNENWTISHN